MTHSRKCSNKTTFWDIHISKCVLCPRKPGYEVATNCGLDDDGGQHEPSFIKCKADTFNDGSGAHCQPCAPCPHGSNISTPCRTTSNTKCQAAGSGATGVPVPEPTTSHYDSSLFSTTIQTNQGSSFKPRAATIRPVPFGHDVGPLWAIPFAILISIMLVVICACLIYMKRRRGQHTALSYRRRSSYINAGFSPLSAPPGNNDLEHILSPDILSAPLQTVLDKLDVLEELVILLDPENQGVKNTKHLASHCSFPATWITYTYSMKESKSPLKAVLEGVTSRQPDWTVGHLARLLKHMERNDAIAVLAKLGLNVMQV
ncbi:IGF-like family receptor 1 [Anarrhichthys ocellatus]|uniref:IGF-like family receptor 1 n=1 Tax=Anarrhichthys ocellatus TaxID=433405 RepID=UPI0012EDF42C|nr:IGF-like family receptor 1 [Anarrhichthys ocellatus]